MVSYGIYNDGVYVCTLLDDQTKEELIQYITDYQIPNAVTKEQLHSTLIYSDSNVLDLKPICDYPNPLIGQSIGIEIWDGPSIESNTKKYLVLTFKCDGLLDRHQQILNEYNIQHKYSEFISHVTLSYDVSDFDIALLPDIVTIIPSIKIIGEVCTLPCPTYNKESTE